MPSSVLAPRVNNNDDEVTVVAFAVSVGDRVDRGQIVGQVETDKAIIDVESPTAGFVIHVAAEAKRRVAVGSVLLWLGEHANEQVPAEAIERAPARDGDGSGSAPTAKALQMLREHGLSVSDVSHAGPRLTAADVERHLAGGSPASAGASPATPVSAIVPEIEGRLLDLRNDERGMLATVSWHRDVAVPGYIELPFDPGPWENHAKAFAERHRLLLSPLLSLIAWRLVEVARETPVLNATIVGNQRYEYLAVNIGFTVQADDTLYLAVVRDAGALGDLGFVHAMSDIQRRAGAHRLGPTETSGATIGFSSMARWKVARHIPVLSPHTALMVAHAASPDGQQVLGATYDHRVLNGFQVTHALRKLARPPQDAV